MGDTKESERANAPRYRGERGFYEIWFLVVFEVGARRATWLRYTLFTPAPGAPGEPRAIVWAASFDACRDPPAIAQKAIHPIAAMDLGAPERFHVKIGSAEIGHGFCRGAVASAAHRLEWDLRFTPAEQPVLRTPRIADRLPLSTHAAHANDRVPFEGWVEVDGVRRVLSDAVGTQAHIWGTRRVEALSWIRAPSFAEDRDAALEVVVARPRVRGPRTASLFLAHDGKTIDLTDLPFAVTNRAHERKSGRSHILDVHAATPKTIVNVRARCDPRTLVGYVYRDPRGHDLYVAQSDLASCEVEVLRRHGLGMEPEKILTCEEGTALELHGTEPLPDVRYVEWDDEVLGPTSRAPAPRASVRAVAPSGASFEYLPEVRSIVALGLTYRDHARETASDGTPAAFIKERASLLLEGERVAIPSHHQILAALDRLEPGLARALCDELPLVLPIMDYEAELAMVVLDATPREALADARFVPRIGWTVANDLTARACQVLGSGQPDPMRYWSVAKGFPGFLPMTSRMYVPADPSLVPDVVLTTTVNGEPRQSTPVKDLLYSPRELAAQAAALLGRDLARGDVVLTGTPSGVAFAVSRAKRWLGERLLDRFGRLRAAIAMAASSDRFLRAGDVVAVEAGFLGKRVVELVNA
jgi:2-keto-4-pentenoate hydratase/2-oxohepta-3-ene-1,7-dioic acid hydratase in catechol pathway